MRQALAVVTTLLGGCSFIYNPDHINPDIDAIVIDSEIITDVDPTRLNIDYAYPNVVFEGAGQAHARPAVIVLRGEQIESAATVSVVPASGPPSQITVNGFQISGDHDWIAISISAPVDMNQDETGTKMTTPIPLIITVDNGNGTTFTLPSNALALDFLDQLTTPITAPVPAKKVYSNIAISAADTFPSGIGRISLHSMSGLAFTAAITLSAPTMTTPGAGGCAGGAVGGGGATTSTGDGAPCNSGAAPASGAGGASGGYGGDPQISNFANATPGGGGGGGQTAGLLGGAVGGAGAGMISLEAGGDLTVTTITAKGGAGSPTGLAGGGGGGAGGTILLRSGGTLSVGSIDASPGGGGTGGGGANGAPGAAGHIRFDAAHGSAPSGFNGAMFLAVPYYSFAQQTPTIAGPDAVTLAGPGGDSTSFSGQAYDKDLTAVPNGMFTLTFSGAGLATPAVMLAPGYNLLCATVANGNVFQRPESGNCAEIAYLPGPHS